MDCYSAVTKNDVINIDDDEYFNIVLCYLGSALFLFGRYPSTWLYVVLESGTHDSILRKLNGECRVTRSKISKIASISCSKASDERFVKSSNISYKHGRLGYPIGAYD
ncbi:unnamed protein product [Dracunculus medinensis]|uniref:Transmembrane protein n=1 Tax=Dracunculus medinensis TaxID=318479 RepID=A0A0N4U256_DRAME|nr:unnamed protein product [Dracunculus medinensis]